MSAIPAATPSSRVDSAPDGPADPPSAAAASASSSAASSSAAAAVMVSDLAVPGGQYTGPVVKGKPEGHGRLIELDGSVYTGDFSQGKKHGVGECRWTNGRLYQGQWENNKRSGLGAQWDEDGDLGECGEWQNDKFEAFAAVPLRFIPEGKHLSAATLKAKRDHPDRSALLDDGTHYIGELNAQGQPDGQGASFHPDGSPEVTLHADADESLSGQWINGMLNGRVTELLANGDRHEGLFKDGLRHGLTVFNRKDGSHYEGEWGTYDICGLGAEWDKDGKRTHCGRWTHNKFVKSCAVPLRLMPKGTHLSAAALQAKRDHPDGSALMSSGMHYIGELNADGQPHGQGSSFYSTGSPFETLQVDPTDPSLSGRWDNGKLHGRATQQLYGCYEGLFKDGLREGFGVFSGEDGSRYEGEWANKRSGPGVQWDKDGKLTHCGRWAKGKFLESCSVPLRLLPDKRFLSPHAKTASLLFPDGGYFVGPLNAQDQRHGEGSMFSAAGNLLSSGTWSNDQLQSGAASSVSAQIAPAPSAAATPAASASATAAASSSSSSPSSSFAFQLPLQCSNRKALIIGNSKYDAVNPLPCCVNDADDMQAALRQLGFQCTRLVNASQKQLNRGLREFIKSLQPNDIVFLHYSGHGEESAGITYMVPTDYGHNDALEDDAVSLNKIMQRLNEKNCDLINIIVLDCCRANVHDETFRGGGDEMMRSAISNMGDRAGGQSFVRKPTSGHFFIAFSSDPGTVSHETTGGRNGWFTGCVLQHLLTPGLRITEIFGMAADSMEEKHGKKQRSWLELTGSHKKNIIMRPQD